MNAGLEPEPLENCKSELFVKFIFEICRKPSNIQTMEKPFEARVLFIMKLKSMFVDIEMGNWY